MRTFRRPFYWCDGNGSFNRYYFCNGTHTDEENDSEFTFVADNGNSLDEVQFLNQNEEYEIEAVV